MSRIDDLIRELCPEGIIFRSIGEVTEVNRGSSISKLETTEGNVPVIAGGQKPAYWHSEPNRYGENVVVAGSGAYAGFVSYWNQPIWASDSFTVTGQSQLVLTKFVYYWLKNMQQQLHSLKRGSGVPHVYAKDVAKILIAVPPLEIQKEIVSILDKFTQLEAELEAELEARRTQYEVTRDRLLDFSGDPSTHPMGEKIRELCPEGVNAKSIGSFASCLSGATPRSGVSAYWSQGTIPWMSSGEVNKGAIFATEKMISEQGYNSCSTKMVPANSVVIALAGQGKTRGMVAITRIELCTNQSLCSIVCDETVIPEYLLHFLRTQYQNLRTLSSGDGGRGGLNLTMIRDYHVPVPPLEVQKQIVTILDKLDALVNDISSGIPAEIKARRKQYEYYRNKLLTFKELDAA